MTRLQYLHMMCSVFCRHVNMMTFHSQDCSPERKAAYLRCAFPMSCVSRASQVMPRKIVSASPRPNREGDAPVVVCCQKFKRTPKCCRFLSREYRNAAPSIAKWRKVRTTCMLPLHICCLLAPPARPSRGSAQMGTGPRYTPAIYTFDSSGYGGRTPKPAISRGWQQREELGEGSGPAMIWFVEETCVLSNAPGKFSMWNVKSVFIQARMSERSFRFANCRLVWRAFY